MPIVIVAHVAAKHSFTAKEEVMLNNKNGDNLCIVVAAIILGNMWR